MTVRDFIDLLIDDGAHVHIYDIDHDCALVYDGAGRCCDEFEDWTICSIDSIFEGFPADYFGLNCVE